MKIFKLLTGLLATSLSSHAAVITTINGNGRTIDVETATSGNFISLADLQTVVTTTADTTKAGVLSGEGAADAVTTIGDELSDASATFTFSGPNRYSRNDVDVALAATSGGRFGLVAASNTWSLGSSVLGEGVTHFGTIYYGYLNGGSANLASVTATFSDATTAVYTATAGDMEYSFVGFQAPSGEFITEVRVVESSGGGWLGFDDVTIVSGPAVPEPTSAALLLCGLSFGLLRRRR